MCSNRIEHKGKKGTIAVLSVFMVLLLLVSIALLIIYSVLGKIDFVSDDEKFIKEDIGSIVLSDSDEEIVSGADVFDDAMMADIDMGVREAQVDENGLKYEDGVTNVLLLGTDGRSVSNTRARSDTIIILSINENTKKIVMTSIMRDTYVAIPGRPENEKITHAHAYGGAPLTVQTVQNNFGIKIDKFAEVNFYAFADIVDALGGVTVEHITDGERTLINKEVRYQSGKMNYVNEDGDLYLSDNVHLNGLQALAYARIRKVGNGDYQRSDRQRELLGLIINKVKDANYLTLMNVLTEVADNLSTDYSETELLKLAMNAAKYKDYEVVQQRLPIEGSYIGGIYHGRWVLRIDFDSNREAMYSMIFGE